MPEAKKIIKMNKLRATITKLIFLVFPLMPLQVLGEGSLEHNEEIFESVCRDYEIIGLSTKCANNMYEVEKPLIYKHQLTAPIHALYVLLNSKDNNIDQKSCSFEFNEEIIFERFCNPKITIIEKDIMLIGSSMYFVYARRASQTGTEFGSNYIWDVYWNKEAYADHAHTPLGKARLVSEGCLQGDNFKACIE